MLAQKRAEFSQVEMWFLEASAGFLDAMDVNKEGLVIRR